MLLFGGMNLSVHVDGVASRFWGEEIFLDDGAISRRGINAFRVASLDGALTEAHAALRMSFEVAFSTPVTRQLHHSIGTGVVQHARRRAVMQRKVQAWRSQQRARHVCRR